MLNQLLKFTLFSSLLLWLKPRWKGLLALCVAVVLVHVIHGEYLGYVELSGDRAFLVWSYILKWAALAVSVLVYLFFILSPTGKAAPGAAIRRASRTPDPVASGTADDGFDFLRDKKQLRSRADMVTSQESGEKRR